MIGKKPFTSYTLDEDKSDPLEKGKVFTMRLNPREVLELKEDMKLLNCTGESTTMKLLARVGRNVLHGTFSPKDLAWISNPSRRSRENV